MAAEEETPAAEARLPPPHEYARRAQNHQASSREAPYTVGRLGWARQEEARDGGVGAPLTLKRASDFDRAFRQGERFRSREMLVIRLFRDQGGARVAFLTAKGVGRAASRNRLRRQLREACRSIWPQVADKPADVLFMALPPARESGYGSLKKAMVSLLRKAGILDLALSPEHVSVHPVLFRVCRSGDWDARGLERMLAGRQAHRPMPPVL